jgi:hypothetical protein
MKKWLLLVLALLIQSTVFAQTNWPNRPIRLLVPYPAGGSTDILTRLVGQSLCLIPVPALVALGICSTNFSKQPWALNSHTFPPDKPSSV